MNHPDHVLAQATAGAGILSFLMGYAPIILAVPAALYYLMLVIEKVTGRTISDILGLKKSC